MCSSLIIGNLHVVMCEDISPEVLKYFKKYPEQKNYTNIKDLQMDQKKYT